MNQRQHLQNKIITILIIGFILSLLTLSQFWTLDFNTRQSQGQRLSQASQKLLKQLKYSLEIRAYVGQNEAHIYQSITDLVSRYQHNKADIKLTFIDPEEAPREIQEQNIQHTGELRLIYQGKTTQVTSLSEQSFSQALQQLSREQQHWIVFLQGHGERDPQGDANFDLSHWAAHLHSSGLRIQNLHLSEIGQIPDNTQVLILASPRVDLLPEEIQQIQNYIKQGGHLLWLLDPSSAPDQLMGLQPLADQLELQIQQGTVIDLGSRRLFGKARDKIALIKDYGEHPISQGLQNQLAILPESMALAHHSSHWQSTALLYSIEDTWLETDDINKTPLYNPEHDIKGPLKLAYALSRQTQKQQQRIVIIGDGDFLSNQYLENSANLDLGLNIINWLVKDEHLLNIPSHQRADAALNLSENHIKILSFSFLFALPLGFIALGLFFWWRQR